jgi:FkbM family methyltransferase
MIRKKIAVFFNVIEKLGGINWALKVRNFRLLLKRVEYRFYLSKEKGLFYIKDQGVIHYFANLERGFDIYGGGIAIRADRLWKSYLLDEVDFKFGDVVIDCGANYADLWLKLKNKIHPMNYITFEPGVGEFASIISNVPNSINNKTGLGDSNGKTTFYVNDRDADSSLIEPSCYFDKLEVETITLDEYFLRESIYSVKLLKLEAEGFEPEILVGAQNVLSKIEYIAIDGGYERGVDCHETFSQQTNFLLQNNFEMIGVNLGWGRALFRQKF